jgi:hypothetical protein
VKLTKGELDNARNAPIEMIPHVELAPGRISPALTTVMVKMPSEQGVLQDYTITSANLGLVMSINLQGLYRVEVKNFDAVLNAISISATDEAKRVYEKNILYQVLLVIEDKDAEAPGPFRREVVYNFPPAYLEKGEIKLNQQPVIAQFSLVPLEIQPAAATVGPR